MCPRVQGQGQVHSLEAVNMAQGRDWLCPPSENRLPPREVCTNLHQGTNVLGLFIFILNHFCRMSNPFGLTISIQPLGVRCRGNQNVNKPDFTLQKSLLLRHFSPLGASAVKPKADGSAGGFSCAWHLCIWHAAPPGWGTGPSGECVTLHLLSLLSDSRECIRGPRWKSGLFSENGPGPLSTCCHQSLGIQQPVSCTGCFPVLSDSHRGIAPYLSLSCPAPRVWMLLG